MDLWENIYLAVSGLLANKMRAILTMLGIIIGIAAVIAIMTLGNSVTNSVTNTMAEMGGNNIVVQLSLKEDVDTFVMTEDDLISDEMLEQMREVYADDILAVSVDENIGSGSVKDGRKYANVSIYGVNDGYQLVNNVKMLTGRYINATDQERPPMWQWSPTRPLRPSSEQNLGRWARRSKYTGATRYSPIRLWAFTNTRKIP